MGSSYHPHLHHEGQCRVTWGPVTIPISTMKDSAVTRGLSINPISIMKGSAESCGTAVIRKLLSDEE